MKSLVAAGVLLAVAAFRLTRAVIGTIGLQHELGLPWALLALACLVLFRLALPIRIGAFIALMSLWGWPWYAALLFAAPRLPMMLPGLLSSALARYRHPRPLWPSARTV